MINLVLNFDKTYFHKEDCNHYKIFNNFFTNRKRNMQTVDESLILTE